MRKLLLTALFLTSACGSILAEAPVRLGVRAGLNSSNISETRILPGMQGVHGKDWKTGFEIGAVVDIPMTHNFFLQPGFFFDRHNNGYVTSITYPKVIDDVTTTVSIHTKGHVGTNWFQIPVLVSYRFQPFNGLEIQADFGPYFAYGIGGSDKYTAIEFSGDVPALESPEISEPSFGHNGHYFRTDWGFKMGVGFEVAGHYYFATHYMAGARNLSRVKKSIGDANNRSWQFTVGYNF